MSRSCLTALALGALLACGKVPIDAVTGSSCEEHPEQAACARPSWPNEYSAANSDPWLALHHDSLREIRARVLVLDFHNDTRVDMRGVAERQFDALAEGSRYRAYLNRAAQAFLRYELLKIIDLKDRPPPPDWRFSSSTRVPIRSGRFDLRALFGPEFAQIYGYPDESGTPQQLCTLFERGIINELWLAVGDEEDGREPPSMVECKARYDAQNRRIPGALVASSSSEACESLPVCGVSVRIAHLSPVRGPGCDLLVRGWAIRGSLRAIPYLADNARVFLDECGDPEFPPNATAMWDFENTTPAEAHCAHYGLRDGPNGNDLREMYSADTVEELAMRYRDCGGGWQVYWRQSMPGLDNAAFARDGSAMKNWWPFLFY